MDSWLAHMPKGMMLKSDGFASNIYDPEDGFTLKHFCTEQGINYSDTGLLVSRETFTQYGLAFRERMVPELEEKLVVSVEHSPDGFVLELEDGEMVKSRRVVLAVGITHFAHVPSNLAHLPPELLSHSFAHHDLERFRGRSVVVIGGGSSATDLAGLLREADADVQLVARATELKFHGRPQLGKPRSLWQRVRNPQSGLGPGWRSRFFADAPMMFHYWPESLRLKTVRKHLGPSGGWFAKEKVVGKLPVLLGHTVVCTEAQGSTARLQLRTADGGEREIVTDHIIAATGYKVDLERLRFLSTEIRAKVKAVDGTPVLSKTFESSVPGLYFVGVASANSFGPVMRFAFGAGFTARRLAETMAKSLSLGRAFGATRRVLAVKDEGTGAI
jgi:thioredoxin reductase